MKTHGEAGSQLYLRWQGMKNRCNNPNTINYLDYGAKGIKVCQEWSDSYESFRDWALNNGYKSELTIERHDGSGDYSPNNCYWASRAIQSANRGRFRKAKYRQGAHKQGDRWQSRIQINGSRVHLGMFGSEDEAAEARNAYIRANNLPHRLG